MPLRVFIYTVLEKDNLAISMGIYCWHHFHLHH
jgi:hypothetical protein